MNSFCPCQTMIPMDGIEIFNAALQITENIAYYVPRNVNTDQGPSSHVTSAKTVQIHRTPPSYLQIDTASIRGLPFSTYALRGEGGLRNC